MFAGASLWSPSLSGLFLWPHAGRIREMKCILPLSDEARRALVVGRCTLWQAGGGLLVELPDDSKCFSCHYFFIYIAGKKKIRLVNSSPRDSVTHHLIAL